MSVTASHALCSYTAPRARDLLMTIIDPADRTARAPGPVVPWRARLRELRPVKPGPSVLAALGPLIAACRGHARADIAELRRAYEVAERMHRGQTRKSGAPYITHPLAVATILAE